jgi:hypothetical protein
MEDFSSRFDVSMAEVTCPKFLVWPEKGPKSWICGNGQKLGAASSFQH